MSMRSAEEGRAYSRGYAAGRKSGDEAASRACELLEQEQAAKIAALAGKIGQCHECRHWERGGETWGYCRAPGEWLHRAIIVPAGRNYEIQTRAEFGCQRFTPESNPKRIEEENP